MRKWLKITFLLINVLLCTISEAIEPPYIYRMFSFWRKLTDNGWTRHFIFTNLFWRAIAGKFSNQCVVEMKCTACVAHEEKLWKSKPSRCACVDCQLRKKCHVCSAWFVAVLKARIYVQFLLRSRWRDEYKFSVHVCVSLIILIYFIIFSINAATRVHILYFPYFL